MMTSCFNYQKKILLNFAQDTLLNGEAHNIVLEPTAVDNFPQHREKKTEIVKYTSQ